MKKSTFLFSLLLSVATLGLHAQKPESGTYTISNVSYSEVTLADNQFLGIGAKNDDGTYQTYSLQMNQPGTTTVFDVYAKLDELLASLKQNVKENFHIGDEMTRLTAPDMATLVQLVSEGYTKINVEPTNTTDAEGNAIVRFKVGVPTFPNFMDNAFMTLVEAQGARRSGFIWEYALDVLAEEYASDPAGLFIVQTAKRSLAPITYRAYQINNNAPADRIPAKCRYYYICATNNGSVSFIRESLVNNTNYNTTLWALAGESQPENVVSGEYYIKNVGNGKYINYDGTQVAQPDLSILSLNNKGNAVSNLEVGRIREGENIYQIDELNVNGKSIFDYLINTISPDETTIKNYTKSEIRSKKGFYNEALASGQNFFPNFGYIRDYETVMIADWYIKKFGKLKMQDNGDGTVSFFVDLPPMPYTATYLETYFGSASLWEILKSSALVEITDNDEHEFAANQLDKLTPGSRYYIIANDDNEFDFVSATDFISAGDKAKWSLGSTEELVALGGYYRVENATTGNVLELWGNDASTIEVSSDDEECVTNASTVFSLELNNNVTDYEIMGMTSQGVDFMGDLGDMLNALAQRAGLGEFPRIHIKPVGDEPNNYVAYFDMPKMTDRQFLAVLALVLNDVKDPAATELFFSNVQPNKRYSIAQVPGSTKVIAVEGDQPNDYNVWKLREINNNDEYFALNFPTKVSSTEDGITYYYCTLNTDFAYTIPETSQIVGAYVVPTVTKGIAHPEFIGGHGIQIPANTPVILESLSTEVTENRIDIIPEVTDAIEIPNNYLIGTLLAEPIEANGRSRENIRVFNISSKGVVGFYKYTGDTLVKNKGYLDLSTVTDELVNTYTMSFDEMGPTAIDDIDVEQSNGSGEIYDIQGRKVNKPSKGLYIINGKKVLVR